MVEKTREACIEFLKVKISRRGRVTPQVMATLLERVTFAAYNSRSQHYCFTVDGDTGLSTDAAADKLHSSTSSAQPVQPVERRTGARPIYIRNP
jgi:hypothetical protein